MNRATNVCVVHQARDQATGQYAFHGGFDRLCACGHPLGEHVHGGFECICPEAPRAVRCTCERFRPTRRKTATKATDHREMGPSAMKNVNKTRATSARPVPARDEWLCGFATALRTLMDCENHPQTVAMVMHESGVDYPQLRASGAERSDLAVILGALRRENTPISRALIAATVPYARVADDHDKPRST